MFEDEAEDNARVLRLNARVDIDVGTFAGCLKTKEWSPLEHGSIEHKYYCPSGGGLMLVNELKGGTLRVEFIGNTLPRATSRRRGFARIERCGDERPRAARQLGLTAASRRAALGHVPRSRLTARQSDSRVMPTCAAIR
jgi:hypothetical protein